MTFSAAVVIASGVSREAVEPRHTQGRGNYPGASASPSLPAPQHSFFTPIQNGSLLLVKQISAGSNLQRRRNAGGQHQLAFAKPGGGDRLRLALLFAVQTDTDGSPKSWGCEVIDGEAVFLNGGAHERLREMALRMRDGSRPWQKSSTVNGVKVVMQKEVYHGEMVTMYPTPSKHSLLIASVFFMSSDKQGAELDSGLAV